MELVILDTQFKAIAVLDSFESIIWTDRYADAGDFEIYTPASSGLLDIIKQDYYLRFAESDYMMIVEAIEIQSDAEEGNKLIITGRSLESILDRRIIWSQTVITGNLQNGIKKILNDNLINPSIADRKIDNFIFEESTDTAVTSISIEGAQYTGDNVLDVIKDLCDTYNLGFKVILNDNNQFVFSLYAGVNRSYDQETNPYVVFSPNFENIVNSNYIESKKTLKNVALVAGEGEGAARKTVIVGSGAGIERRELFTDARDISSNIDGGTLSDAQYKAQLRQRGTEDLAENVTTKTFEGQVEATQLFKYGEDFFLGDIVQIVNEYGIESKSRVMEMVRSQSEEGYDIYPTFKILDNEGEND